MMEGMTVGELLKDFRSIKLPPAKRALVDQWRERFESVGVLSNEQRWALFDLAKRYRRQFAELHAARGRARRTNGLRAMGITREEAQRRVDARRAREEMKRNDLGF